MSNSIDSFGFMRIPADFFFDPELISKINDKVESNSFNNEVLEAYRSSDFAPSKGFSKVRRLSVKKK